IFSDVSWEDLNGQFDVCYLTHKCREDDDDDGLPKPKWLESPSRWQLTRIRSLPLKTARGRWKLITGKLVEMAVCLLLENSTWFGVRKHFELRNKQWITLPPCKAFQANSNPDFHYAPNLGAHDSLYEFEQDEQLRIQLAMGFAFSRQYEWHV